MGQTISILQLAKVTSLPYSRKAWSHDAKLPESHSPDLHLNHPEAQENTEIWKLTSDEWKDALTIPLYLEESPYLMTVPLARNGGMTQWVLVDRHLPPGQRRLLASCETFRKRSLISDSNGTLTEGVTHGIASVYVDPEYRRRGYATRLMKELARTLPHWQTETQECVASVLFSDIGRTFYKRVGWKPFHSHHIEFEAVPEKVFSGATSITGEDVPSLCSEDEAMVRRSMACPLDKSRWRYTILPDLEHMRWHHSKEEWVCEKLFGKSPLIKGALAGQSGNRVWAIWTHRFYHAPDGPDRGENTLYILRLVLEDQDGLQHFVSSEQGMKPECLQLVRNLRAVIQAARNEAASWNLSNVKLWGPTPEIEEAIKQTGLPHHIAYRDQEGISCLLWYGEGSGSEDEVQWIGNEKYGWC